MHANIQEIDESEFRALNRKFNDELSKTETLRPVVHEFRLDRLQVWVFPLARGVVRLTKKIVANGVTYGRIEV